MDTEANNLKLVKSYLNQEKVMERLDPDLQDACGCLQRALEQYQRTKGPHRQEAKAKVNAMAATLRPEIEASIGDIMNWGELPVEQRPQTNSEKNALIVTGLFERGMRKVSKDDLVQAGFTSTRWDKIIKVGDYTLVKHLMTWTYTIMDSDQYAKYRT